MADEFEKMDDYLKKVFRDQKDIFQPGKDLKGFSDSVVKRILERQRNRQIGFGIAAGFSAVAVFGMVMVFVMQPRPATAPEISAPAAVEAKVPASMVNQAREIIPAVSKKQELVQAPAATVTVPEPVTEETLAAEIEALKDLGVWTEQDEEEIGIPADVIFAEIQTYLETEQPSIAMPSQQVAG